MKTITYYLRGQIERGTGNGYRWHDGYSSDSDNGSPIHPWSTKRECQAEARAIGARAVFTTASAQIAREMLKAARES